MPKIKEASSFNGTSWGAAIPIGADDANVDITSATTDPGGGAVPGVPGDTSTSLDSAAVTVSSTNSDTDASAWTKFNRFRARVKNALANLSVIAIQDDTPTQGEKLWLDTSGEGLQIPQINDNVVSRTDTWSSHRISAVGIAVQDEAPLEDSKVWIDTDETTAVTVPEMSDLANVEDQVNQNIAYVENGNTASRSYAQGEYLTWKGTLYTAKENIPQDTAFATGASGNLSDVSGGGLNALNDNLKNTLDQLKTETETIENGLAIIIEGDTCASGASQGQYVYLKDSTITGYADGLYTAAQAIPANTAIDGTYLTAVSGGGLNSLKNALPQSGTSNVTNVHASAKLRGSFILGKYGKIVSPLGYFQITSDVGSSQALASIDNPSFYPNKVVFLSIHKTGTSTTGALSVNAVGNITTGDFSLPAGYYVVTGSYLTN